MEQILIENSEIILRLVTALGLGMLIGAERTFVHKEAGMKTHSLIAMGAAIFVLVSEEMAKKYIDVPGFNPIMMASQVIVGVGFLGAGSIILQGSKLKGLTTASGFWVTAGIGMTAGFGLYGIAIISTVFILLVFIAMNIIENPIKKISEKNLNENERDS